MANEIIPESWIKLGMETAFEEALRGRDEGGIPIGSALMIEGKIVGRGHNRRVQKNSPTLHAEIDCIEAAGRLKPAQYKNSILFSTLSPCHLCSGCALLYKIPMVVFGENETFQGPESLLKENGVKVINVNDRRCRELMQQFERDHADLWNEDIGE